MSTPTPGMIVIQHKIGTVGRHSEHFLTSFTHDDRLLLQVDHPNFRAVPPHFLAAIFLRLLQSDPLSSVRFTRAQTDTSDAQLTANMHFPDHHPFVIFRGGRSLHVLCFSVSRVTRERVKGLAAAP